MPPDFEFDSSFDAELESVTTFLVERSRQLARAFGDDFERAIRRALQFPSSGSPRVSGARAIRIGNGPYSIVYLVGNDGRFIRFLALEHASRRPGYWRERL